MSYSAADCEFIVNESTVYIKSVFLSRFWTPKSLQMVTAALKLKLLLLGRKAMTNLDRVLKSRDITLSTKVHLAKAMVFPVVMYGCELECKES